VRSVSITPSRRAALVLGVVLVTVGSVACGDDDDGGSSGDGTMHAQLARIPDTAANRAFVVVADHAAARAAVGVERPGDDATDDEILDHILELSLRAEIGFPTITDLEQTHDQAAFRDELGFDAADLDAVARAGEPPEQLEVFVGEIVRDDVAAAVESDPIWSDELATAEHADVEYWTWFDDGELDVERQSASRRLGQSLRIAVLDDGIVLSTRTTPTMEAALDVAAGDADSLADDEELGALADRLDELGAIAALFTDQAWSAEQSDDGPEPLVPWTALASGVTLDDDGEPVLVFLLAHADEGDADENAERLEAILDDGVSALTRTPWSELLQSPEVSVDGRVVALRAEIDGPRAPFWQQVVLARDSLFAT
jgi:hypothetical protein